MKIIMIPSGYYPDCCGGVEVITQAIAEGLVGRNHEVVVICCANSAADYWHNGVHVIKLKPKTLQVGPKSLINRANRMLQMYNPFHIGLLEQIIKSEDPDVIHLHMARQLSMAVLTAAERCGIPTVSTLHEYFSLWNFDPFHKMDDVVCSKPQFYVEWVRNIHRKITKRVKYVTSPMEKTFEIYQTEKYYSSCKYMHIENALWPVSTSDLIAVRKNHAGHKPGKILIISRLMPFKGIEESINLFLKSGVSEKWELHIAGDGPLRNYVEDECAKNDTIFFHGYVIDDDKEQLFNACDVLLFLTSELETFGLVVLEAFQHGMPVVVSNVAAMRKLVKHQKNGMILSSLDEACFKDAFDFLLNENNYCRLVNEICKMELVESYSRMLDAYEKVYNLVRRDNG